MGRYIYCDQDCVYQFPMGDSSSLFSRIHTEYGIGRYQDNPPWWMDTLTLTRDDVKQLGDVIANLHAEPPWRAWKEAGFMHMLEAMLAYTQEHPELESYYFKNHYG